MVIIFVFCFVLFVFHLPAEHVARSSLLENSSRPFCLDHLLGVTAAECFLRGDLLWVVVDLCDDDDDDDDGDVGTAFADFAVVKCANTSAALSSIRSEN